MHLNISSISDPFRNGLSRESNPLYIHSVVVLRLPFSREVYENRSSVQLHLLKDVRTIVKVHHSKEKFIRKRLRVPKRVGDDCELVVSVLANDALPLRSQRGKHYNHGVVSRRRAHIVSELVTVELKYGPLRDHVGELLDPLRHG